MRLTSAVVGGALLALAVACESPAPTASRTSDPSSNPPGGSSLSLASAPARSTADHFVTGNAIFPFDGVHRKAAFSFTARKLPDGSVEGQFQNFDQTRGFPRVHGTMDCLNVDDSHTARLQGTVNLSADPLIPVGSKVYWRVNDTGPGTKEPDSTTYLYVYRRGLDDDQKDVVIEHLCAVDAADYDGFLNGVISHFQRGTRQFNYWASAKSLWAIDQGNLVVH